MGPGLRIRQAVRAVVLDPVGRILLVGMQFPDKTIWICPGGGLAEDESEEAALRRELAEEVGLTLRDLGPCVWRREHVIPMFGGAYDGQAERYYLVHTDAFEPRPEFSVEQLAAENLVDVRWWTAEELASTSVEFAPRRLPELLAQLRKEGPQLDVPDVGVCAG